MKLPFAQKIYIRPDWREVQKGPANWIFQTGGRSPSTWPGDTTNRSGSASCLRTPMCRSPGCRSS